jgi:hypothetical protein
LDGHGLHAAKAWEERPFFSEEKKQKTFILCATARLVLFLSLAPGGEIEVFWFFSSEKNAFFS